MNTSKRAGGNGRLSARLLSSTAILAAKATLAVGLLAAPVSVDLAGTDSWIGASHAFASDDNSHNGDDDGTPDQGGGNDDDGDDASDDDGTPDQGGGNDDDGARDQRHSGGWDIREHRGDRGHRGGHGRRS